MNRFYKGVYLIVLSAVGFGVMPIFALYAYQCKMNVATLLWTRFLLSAVLFFIVLGIMGKKIKLPLFQIGSLFIMGGIIYTLQSTLYFNAIRFISPSLTALLFYTYPIIVALLSFFIDHEKLTKRHFFAIAMTFLGLLFVLGTPSNKINLVGILLAFSASLVYSGYIILGNRLIQRIPSIISSAYITLFAAFSFTILGLWMNTLQFDFKVGAWLPTVGIIIFSTIIAILTFFKGLELTGPTTASILSTLEPLVTIGLSVALFHDRLNWTQMLGGLGVISGTIIIVLAKEFSKKTNQIILNKEIGKESKIE
jgi:drug/metabolite transporter (DMT)-like permease